MEPHAATDRAPASVGAMLTGFCEDLCGRLDAAGCIVSRAIGDMLLLVAEHARDRSTFQLGYGYLVTDFPATAHVFETGRPLTVSKLDPDPDPAEIHVLDQYGLTSVLMLSLPVGGRPWALVEVYRGGGLGFSPEEEQAAQAAVDAFQPLLERSVAG